MNPLIDDLLKNVRAQRDLVRHHGRLAQKCRNGCAGGETPLYYEREQGKALERLRALCYAHTRAHHAFFAAPFPEPYVVHFVQVKGADRRESPVIVFSESEERAEKAVRETIPGLDSLEVKRAPHFDMALCRSSLDYPMEDWPFIPEELNQP